jgi:predicted patatin/cPLA2 family phospholipase
MRGRYTVRVTATIPVLAAPKMHRASFRAVKSAIRTGLVVEGGAMRGIFSAGVLDVFHERSFFPFDIAIGASAGACNIACFLALQGGRNRRCYLNQMSRREFIDSRRALRGGHVIDLDWLWDAFAREDPLDVAATIQSRVALFVAVTPMASGVARYVRPSETDLLQLLKGSCALPGLYRGRVEIAGERVVDGSIGDPLPVLEAYRRGARRIVVVRSRDASFVKRQSLVNRASAALFWRTPGLHRAILSLPERYQAAVAFIERPPADCQIVHVTPDGPLAAGRTTQDARALEHDYQLGRRAGERAVLAWEGRPESDRWPESVSQSP